MVYSFPAVGWYLVSFTLLQPGWRQEHTTHFRLMEAVAPNAVEELLQSPPSVLLLQQCHGARHLAAEVEDLPYAFQ